MNQFDKAETLRRLHRGPAILRMANVWDAASARIVEQAGFPAVATGSAGVAFSLGYADGEEVPPAEMFGQVRRIARAVSVPVSADLEAGYDDVEKTAAELIAAGGVGMNLEDSCKGEFRELSDQIDKIRAVRRVGERLGVPIVINARTDIWLRQVGDAATRFGRGIERLVAYRDAGADCLFAPSVNDEETIARLVAAVRFPVNILGTAGTPSIGRLQELGVARVSVGSGPMRATMGLMRRIAEELRGAGTYTTILDGAVPYADAQNLMRRS